MVEEMHDRGWTDEGKRLDAIIARKGAGKTYLSLTPEERESAWNNLTSGAWDSIKK
jgi:hypothetical protein